MKEIIKLFLCIVTLGFGCMYIGKLIKIDNIKKPNIKMSINIIILTLAIISVIDNMYK